jgi:hypothetical protein
MKAPGCLFSLQLEQLRSVARGSQGAVRVQPVDVNSYCVFCRAWDPSCALATDNLMWHKHDKLAHQGSITQSLPCGHLHDKHPVQGLDPDNRCSAIRVARQPGVTRCRNNCRAVHKASPCTHKQQDDPIKQSRYRPRSRHVQLAGLTHNTTSNTA